MVFLSPSRSHNLDTWKRKTNKNDKQTNVYTYILHEQVHFKHTHTHTPSTCQPCNQNSTIVHPRWVDHLLEIPVLKNAIHDVWHFLLNYFLQHPRLQISIGAQAHFHTQSIKESLVTIACKMAKLFMLFHWSTQCRRTKAQLPWWPSFFHMATWALAPMAALRQNNRGYKEQ